ncbi:MAG: TIGR03960 family B12-binding radical SAM protein [Alphaproteobacteria bacterium]|nr:TIGR03960 family B12-binding radical SAM protein [Alphaproteobacteria bacterium]
MHLRDLLQDEILPRVEKPSRYLGTELNAVHKDPEQVDVRLALAFPDLYDLGLGNLGVHILYAILNKLDWCWCERVYAPAPDMEALLRERGLPMFAIESKDALSALDGLGFTLQSELTFTNILNILDLGGIPLRTADRGEDAPLTFAGGPAVFNPEPLAPFMDFFVIGDGESAVVELAELLRAMRGRPRAEKLAAIAKLEGFYVPALYPMETLPDGRILPPVDGPKIVKRITRDLNGATFPTNYIVPFTQQVHDRVSLEVLRGCTQGCRFCQAGMTTRPVRERTIEKVDELMERTLANTGYEEVSLVSLSTCDYSRVRTLVDTAVSRAEQDRVSVSLPSLRLDSFSVDLADRVADVRRTGLTFAPEAASPRLRAIINKWIPDEDLLNMSAQAYERGWNHVKLYFMIGLPSERDDDIDAIADLTLRTLERGREINRKARVNTGVSTFVPKPFTPFQWAEQIGIEETERRQGILQDRFRGNGAVKFGRHNAEETYLEGLVSRADRRAADLIEAAYRHGARLDAWHEHLDIEAWNRAIEETGYDVADALRARELDERLPWDHIDIMIPKQWFQEDYQRAMVLEHANDCRHSKCHRCGVIDRERPLCAHMLRNSIDGRKEEREWERPERPEYVEPEPVQRLRFRVGRHGPARFLSHLEWMNAWLRTLRRARMPMSYSQGFHPHPKFTFAAAMPVGSESTGEYMDVVLKERVDVSEAFERLGRSLPEGFLLLGAREVELKAESLMAAVEGLSYSLFVPGDAEELQHQVAALMSQESIGVSRKTKAARQRKRGRRSGPRQRDVDLKPLIAQLSVRPGEQDGAVVIDFVTRAVNQRMAKPREILDLLGLSEDLTRVLKRDTFLTEQGGIALRRAPDMVSA